MGDLRVLYARRLNQRIFFLYSCLSSLRIMKIDARLVRESSDLRRVRILKNSRLPFPEKLSAYKWLRGLPVRIELMWDERGVG